MFDHQSTGDEFCVLLKGFAVGLGCAIDIQMVGIHRRDDGHIGCQPVERTVVFVGLDDDIIALFVNQHIRAVVHTYSAQKSIHTNAIANAIAGIAAKANANANAGHQMRQHSRSGGLAVCSGYAEGFLGAGHQA